MGLFVHDDPGYDPSVRQVGFNRYKQLMSNYALPWIKTNILTLGGALPLIFGISLGILNKSVLVTIPASILGGMVFGPFLAGLYDGILRGMRDCPENWWKSYLKSWKNNWKDSLIPGAVLGLFLGVYAFMAALFWWSEVGQTPGTVALYIFSGGLFLLISTLYWPQLVLFRQTTLNRLRNILLFTAKYLWRVAGSVVLKLAYYWLMVLFAPWTLLLLPLLGLWYITFVTQFFLYAPLDQEFKIEEQLGVKKPEETAECEEN